MEIRAESKRRESPMLLAEAVNWTQWMLLAATIVCALFVARRAAANATGSPSAAEAESHEDAAAELGAANRVGRLEVRLHDFAREVEARLETRAAELDRLVDAADREIIRLSELLKSTPGGRNQPRADIVDYRTVPGSERSGGQTLPKRPASSVPMPAAQAQMVIRLHEAGYAVDEIAHIVERSADEVKVILKAA
jgi:hypothetical protein